GRHKPAPDILLLTMRRLGVEPDEPLYVGDMAVAIQTGRAARDRVCVIATRSGKPATLARADPSRRVHTLPQRLPLFPRPAGRRRGGRRRVGRDPLLLGGVRWEGRTAGGACGMGRRGEIVPRLIVIKGTDEGRQFALTEDLLSAGRDSSSRLRLTDTEVSRR